MVLLSKAHTLFSATTTKVAGRIVHAASPQRLLSYRNMSLVAPGSSMVSSVISLQKARPWYNSEEEGSNMAADNAVTLAELFGDNKTVVLFGVPAPFTGTCTLQHYPGYQKLASEFAQADCDEIVCYSVADPYSHHGWEQSLGNKVEEIRFLADPEAAFAKAYGLDQAYDAVSLGVRSKRFSMIVVNGTVSYFNLVEDAAADAQTVLEELKEIKESGEAA